MKVFYLDIKSICTKCYSNFVTFSGSEFFMSIAFICRILITFLNECTREYYLLCRMILDPIKIIHCLSTFHKHDNNGSFIVVHLSFKSIYMNMSISFIKLRLGI